MKQLTINFEATPVEAFDTCREYTQCLTFQQGRPQKAIAADMDLSPSHLSRKLSQSPDDSMRLTVDDLENWVTVNKDPRPIYYLLQKHVLKFQTAEEIQAEIDRLKAQLEEGKA